DQPRPRFHLGGIFEFAEAGLPRQPDYLACGQHRAARHAQVALVVFRKACHLLSLRRREQLPGGLLRGPHRAADVRRAACALLAGGGECQEKHESDSLRNAHFANTSYEKVRNSDELYIGRREIEEGPDGGAPSTDFRRQTQRETGHWETETRPHSFPRIIPSECEGAAGEPSTSG